MVQYKNPLTQKVFQLLMPLTGDFMAQGILKTQFKNMGIDQDTLKITDLPKLAEAVKKGLSAFIGAAAAEQVALKIKNLS
ncbi:MAG: hypothetical protein GX587_00575 [Bacteroidales bacterium]|nr:hypothetical protein [Bacteroidales bacterium]